MQYASRKPVVGMVVSSVVALAVGLALARWGGGAPTAWPLNAPVGLPVPPAAVAAQRVVDAPAAAWSARASSAPPAENSPPALAALRAEVALLRQEVAALQQRPAPGEGATGGAPAREAAAADPRPVLVARAEADRMRHAQMVVREATFQHEPIDREWAGEATDALQEGLASDAVVQPALRRLACRAQTCRVELAGDATGELTQALSMFLHQLDETFSGVTAHYVEDGAGGQTIILYIDRRQ
jgi:hypothetical protein